MRTSQPTPPRDAERARTAAVLFEAQCFKESDHRLTPTHSCRSSPGESGPGNPGPARASRRRISPWPLPAVRLGYVWRA